MSKKVLMVAPNYFTSTFQVGSNHYARAFEKLGYEVLFISNPLSPFHRFSSNSKELLDRWAIYRAGGKRLGQVLFYVPFSLLVPNNYPFFSSNWVLNNWFRLTKPNLLKFIYEAGFGKVDFIWFDSPLFEFLLDKIEFEKSILRIADFSKGFSSVSGNHFRKEIEIGNRVDKVIITAQNLKEKYKDILPNEKFKYVPNGIDLEFFENSDSNFPEEYADIPEPRAVYVGAINDWFDFDLLEYCAKTLEKLSFVLVGPLRRDISRFSKFKNVYFLGPCRYERVPGFLKNAQIGIIPFDVKSHFDLVSSVSPLKLFEYLACGLPVVSVEWDEISIYRDHIFLANSYLNFANYLKESLYFRKLGTLSLKTFSWKEKLLSVIEA